MKITTTVEWGVWGVNYGMLDVEFEGDPQITNDSFSYAGTNCTHGRSGTHSLPNYATMEDSDIAWDKSKYTDFQNSIIETWITNNRETVEDLFKEELIQEVII